MDFLKVPMVAYFGGSCQVLAQGSNQGQGAGLSFYIHELASPCASRRTQLLAVNALLIKASLFKPAPLK